MCRNHSTSTRMGSIYKKMIDRSRTIARATSLRYRKPREHRPTGTGSCAGRSCGLCVGRPNGGLSHTTPPAQPGACRRRSLTSTCIDTVVSNRPKILGSINHKKHTHPGKIPVPSKPGCVSSAVAVHSHTPPFDPRPPSTSPKPAVAGSGCQFRKPVFAPCS